MKNVFSFVVILLTLLLISCSHRSSQAEEEVLAAQMQAMADSIQVALTDQPDDIAKEITGEHYVFFNYELNEDVAPAAEVVVYNNYSEKISSVVFIFSSSKNKLNAITDENTKISYLKYETAIKPGDTLRAKINFKAPEGWKKGDVDRVFLYRVNTANKGSFSPVLHVK